MFAYLPRRGATKQERQRRGPICDNAAVCVATSPLGDNPFNPTYIVHQTRSHGAETAPVARPETSSSDDALPGFRCTVSPPPDSIDSRKTRHSPPASRTRGFWDRRSWPIWSFLSSPPQRSSSADDSWKGQTTHERDPQLRRSRARGYPIPDISPRGTRRVRCGAPLRSTVGGSSC
jgi:hypothetical protein